jgi:hypothetical protein
MIKVYNSNSHLVELYQIGKRTAIKPWSHGEIDEIHLSRLPKGLIIVEEDNTPKENEVVLLKEIDPYVESNVTNFTTEETKDLLLLEEELTKKIGGVLVDEEIEMINIDEQVEEVETVSEEPVKKSTKKKKKSKVKE